MEGVWILLIFSFIFLTIIYGVLHLFHCWHFLLNKSEMNLWKTHFFWKHAWAISSGGRFYWKRSNDPIVIYYSPRLSPVHCLRRLQSSLISAPSIFFIQVVSLAPPKSLSESMFFVGSSLTQGRVHSHWVACFQGDTELYQTCAHCCFFIFPICHHWAAIDAEILPF